MEITTKMTPFLVLCTAFLDEEGFYGLIGSGEDISGSPWTSIFF
jgi:hypothetical protein